MQYPNTSSSGLAATATATDAATGQQVGVVSTVNNFEDSNELRIRLIKDNAGETADGPVQILYGAGEIAQNLPAGVTFSGDFPSIAAFRDYAARVPMQVTGMRFDTNNTDNYSADLIFTERYPNNTVKRNRLVLSTYRVSVGGSYSNAMSITDDKKNVLISPLVGLSHSNMKKNSFIDIFFTVPAIGKTQDMTKISY